MHSEDLLISLENLILYKIILRSGKAHFVDPNQPAAGLFDTPGLFSSTSLQVMNERSVLLSSSTLSSSLLRPFPPLLSSLPAGSISAPGPTGGGPSLASLRIWLGKVSDIVTLLRVRRPSPLYRPVILLCFISKSSSRPLIVW